MKREAANHTKMKRLCRKLDIPRYVAMGIMEAIWHLTAIEAVAGDIGKLSNEDIALGIDYRGDENALIEALVATGWLDIHSIHRLLVHDWWDHAEDSVHMKLARHGSKFACGRIPKLSRLSAKDKESAERSFGLEPSKNAQTVSTRAENQGTADAQPETPCALPCPPIPSHALPSQSLPSNGRTVSETTGFVASPEPERDSSVRPSGGRSTGGETQPPGPIVVPDKPISPPNARKHSTPLSRERIDGMASLLYDFMRNPLPDRPPRHAKAPDAAIVDRCVLAVGEASMASVAEFLRSLQQHYKIPEGGPKSYAWFESTLRTQFASAAEVPR